MDLLQTYPGSDLDTDEEPSCESLVHLQEEKTTKLISQKKDIDDKPDYFSLADDSSSSEGDSPSEPTNSFITRIIESNLIELPQSAFWCAPSTSATGENVSILNKSLVAEEGLTECIPNTEEVDVDPSNAVAKYLGEHKLESSPFYTIITHKRVSELDSIPEKKLKPTHSHAQKHLPSVNLQNPHTTNNEKRNMFFVHGKIAPLLNQKHLKNKYPCTIEKDWVGHNRAINRVNWNISNYSHLALTASMDTTVKIWNIWSNLDPCVKTLTVHDKAVKDAIWDPYGDKILSCSFDRSCTLTVVETEMVLTRLQHEGYVSCCKYHPSNPHIIVTGSTNKISTWDLREPTHCISKFHYKDKLGQIQDLLFDFDGGILFSCSDVVTQNSSDRNIMAWDFKTGVVLSNQIYEERYTCNRLKLYPNKRGSFLAQSQAGYIAIFSTQRPFKMNKTKRFEGHMLQGRSIGFDVSPDGDYVISGSCDGKLYCYDFITGKLFKTWSLDLDFTDIAFHPVLPSTIIASSWDGHLQLLH